ncbi:MAG: galactitol-1-phosphate 5-dehydrogenase [Roseiflexaceae bacterium]
MNQPFSERPERMEALIWTGPQQMHVDQIALPQVSTDEVLVQITAAGICGSEISGYLGQNSLRVPPLVMGHEMAGVIVQPSMAPLRDGSLGMVGTPVVINPLITCGVCDMCQRGRLNQCRKRQLLGAHRPGGFAEFLATPATLCTPLPANVSLEAAVWVEPLACSLRAVRHAALQPDQPLLIIGAGPIGLGCIAAARMFGIQTILISDFVPARLEAALAWGATHAIKADTIKCPADLSRYLPAGQAVEAVIDAVGVHASREQAIRWVVPGGRVVFIGLHEEESPIPANYLIRQEVTVTGSFCYNPSDFAGALALLQSLPNMEQWLDLRPLRAGADSFAELVRGSNVVKITLLPGK